MEELYNVKQQSIGRNYSRIKSGILGLAGIASTLFGYGCTSMPSREDRRLETYDNHIEAHDVNAALETLICSQVGRCREENSEFVSEFVILADRGLDDESNNYASRVDTQGQRQLRPGEYLWEWMPPQEGSHVHRTRFYELEDTLQSKRLALEIVWNQQNSDAARVTLYRQQTTEYEQQTTEIEQEISRAALQAEFYRALGNARVREDGTGYRVGMFVLDQLLVKRIRNLPLLEMALNQPNPFECSERDASNNGLAAYLGEPNVSLNPAETWRHTSYLAILPRLVTRFFVNLFSWPSQDRERRFADGTADAGDYIIRAIQSPFKSLDAIIAGYFGIDRQLYVLFTGYSESGNRLTSEQYWGNAIDVAERAASIASDISGGGSSGVPGVPSFEEGGLQGGLEGGNLLKPRGTP